MKCPSCGSESTGKFCPECGAPLADAQCARCSAPLVAGSRFCTQCGAAARSAIGGNTGWYAAAGVLVVMIALVWILTARNRGAESATAPGVDAAAPFADAQGTMPDPGATPAGANGAPPPLTGTPREQADRLFNRIMTERESGDTAKARFFLPMAIQAYKNAGELEGDGLYHLALLQSSAGQYADAVATARRMLATAPDHLLALGAAAEAAEESGDAATARQMYEHFLRAYPTEKTKTNAEYLDHSQVLPQYEAAARRYLNK